MVSRPILAFAIAAPLCLALGGGACAHAALSRADPRVGSKIGTSPMEVRMWFSEALEPVFSNASIVMPPGQGPAGGKAFVDPKDRRQLVIPVLRPLPAGRYEVKWGVVSVDGHRTEGDFPFTVAANR
jgi:hypothetical protein